MKREYYNQHSDVLNEDMSMIVYGEGGYPVIAFQAQDAKSNNFEDFGMIAALAPFIDEGRIHRGRTSQVVGKGSVVGYQDG